MLRRLQTYESIVPLLLRLGVGLTFFIAGLGKVMGGTERVAGFFGSLGIPLPGLMAPFISYLELLGGLALILGLLTRPFALLFIGDMLVAMLLVTIPAALGADAFAQGFSNTRVELLLLLASACLAILGGGLLSLDEMLFRDRDPAYAEEARPRTVP